MDGRTDGQTAFQLRYFKVIGEYQCYFFMYFAMVELLVSFDNLALRMFSSLT